MTEQSLFVDKAYQEALDYADKTINTLAEVKRNCARSDVFYYQMWSNEVALMVFQIVISIAALVFKGKVWELIDVYVLSRINMSPLKDYLSTVYTIGFIGLFLFGVWKLFVFIYAKKKSADLNKIEEIISELEKEKTFAQGIKNTVAKAIDKNEFVQVGNPNNWEGKIAFYQNKADVVGKKTRKIRMWLTIAGSIIATGALCFAFAPYIVDAIAGIYSYYGTMAVCISYFLLMELIYRIQIELFSYTSTGSRGIGFALFGIFQVVILILLKKTTAFTPILDASDFSQVSDSNWMIKIICFSIKYLINEGVCVIALVSIIGLMHLVRTNPERESSVLKDGVDIPMNNGTVNHVNSAKRWLAIFSAGIFAAVAPFLMSNILIEGASFGRVILYLVIGLMWFVISTAFTGEEVNICYGKRMGWVKNALFCSYFFLTLSLVPGFGIGSIVLILFQSLLSLIAVGILVEGINEFI